MKRNDDTIQKLFDDYAEELNERSDLAENARQALIEQNVKKEKQRKPKVWNWLAPICAALIVIVVSVSIWRPIVGDESGSGDLPNQGENATVNYYSPSEVKGRRVASSQFEDTLNVSQINDGEFKIVSERYYAFYFENGALAYVKAELGVRSEEGFCEIVIIAEADGVARQDLRNLYEGFIAGRDYATIYTMLDDNGEYVTNAYFAARNSHFYVSAMTGANSWLAEEIISKIL